MLGLSEQRITHTLQVARMAERVARELFNWPEEKCRQMFLLGFLHDVGYEYANHQADHPRIGGELLKEAGYCYWQEVYWHGVVDAPYESDELLVLNVADMLTDASGKEVSRRERLSDIGQRYGVESVQYKDAALLCEQLTASLEPLLHEGSWLADRWG